jgi:hypothetical protein
LSVRPNIRLRIVPEPVLCPPFQLLGFDESAPVVHLANLNSTLLSQRPATVAGYRRLVARLDEWALGTDASRTFLDDVATGLGDSLEEYL